MILQSELINLISKNTNISKEAVRKIIRQYVKFIVIALENDESVRTSLGTFASAIIKQKEVQNFKTGKREKMHPKKKVLFNPSRLLVHSLDKINADLYLQYEKSQKDKKPNAKE